MSSLTPVRDDQSGARRDLSVSGSRARLHGSPWSGGVTRPRSLFSVALLRRGSRPGRAGAKFSGGMRGAKYPVGSASRYCGGAARPWHFALAHSSAFSRPWQWTTLGCLAREFSACFRCRRISPPALSTTGPLTNQAYMSKREAHGEGEAYPRYPPLARPDDAEKREPIPWVRLPQARSSPWRRTPGRRGREWMKSFPWPPRSLN
jgi:hypothetical protein